jgi:signal transduction histidine kinase
MARRGRPYGLGNVLSSPVGPVMNFAVPFRTSYGTRILVTGFRPRLMGLFLAGDLRKIPGVRGSVNYVIDGNGMVLASTARRTPPGARFTGPFPRGDQTHLAREAGGRYYDEVRLADSGWRIVLESPDGPLYAGVSGLSKWLPWGLFGAFALVGLLAAWLVGRVLAAAAQARDANARLATLNAELETSNRLLSERARELARSNEELDQFASIASHDLQEPLRKVRTFTEQLTRQESERLSEKGQDYLRRANAAAARMQTLIEDLLRFSRVSTHARRPTEVDLGAVARDVLEDLSATIGAADARVHLDELPVVMAESAQMRQLLQNLVSNAVKFAAKDRRPEVWVTSEIAGDELRLSVRDNGIGFDARHAERIFGVFERLHGRGDYPGTGIGLALCRKIVERHGGTITAEARPGEGATLTVTLPRDNSGVHPAPSRPAGRPRPGSGHPVLEGAHV